jgi:hypothetical protein
MKYLFMLFSLLLMLGCSASGPKFTKLDVVKQDNALIYVYRPSAFVNGGMAPYVYINYIKKLKLKNVVTKSIL